MTKMRGLVTLDGMVTVTATYDPEVRWNGWLCPDMDRAAVETVMAAIAASQAVTALGMDPEPLTSHRWDGDTLIVTESDGRDKYHDHIEPDSNGLYGLGAYAWVWSAAEPTDAAHAVCATCYGRIPGCTEPDMGDAPGMTWKSGTCASCGATAVVFWLHTTTAHAGS